MTCSQRVYINIGACILIVSDIVWWLSKERPRWTGLIIDITFKQTRIQTAFCAPHALSRLVWYWRALLSVWLRITKINEVFILLRNHFMSFFSCWTLIYSQSHSREYFLHGFWRIICRILLDLNVASQSKIVTKIGTRSHTRRGKRRDETLHRLLKNHRAHISLWAFGKRSGRKKIVLEKDCFLHLFF